MNRNAQWKRVLDFLPITSFVVGLALYFYHSLFYYAGAGRDDTFITLWTGISLAEGYGFINYNFEPLEMSSSLLHTFIVAVINILAPDFIYTINKVLGLITGAILLVILYMNRHILFGRNILGIITFALTILGLVNNRAWLYWNLGGLENPFQTVIIFLYGLYLIKFWQTPIEVLPLVVLQILYMLVRPEGFLLVFFTSIYLYVRTKAHQPLQVKQFITLVGIPCLIFFSIIIFRVVNFGLLFPNPVYAKIDQDLNQNTISQIVAGIEYLRGFYTSSPYMIMQLVILIAAILHVSRTLWGKRLELVPAFQFIDIKFAIWIGIILFNHLLVITVGGDWMEFYRFIVPIVPFLTILTTCFAFRTLKAVTGKNILFIPNFRMISNLTLGFLFFVAIATNSGQRDNLDTQNFHNCSEKMSLAKMYSFVMDLGHLDENLILSNCAGKRDWDGAMLFITDELPVIYEALDHKVTIATFQMGFFPYYVKKVNPTMNIEFVDTLGLADSNIARMQGPRARYGLSEGTKIVNIFAGKSGQLSEYVLSRNPNMIYVLHATPMRRMALSKLGWTTHWDKPGAVVFIRIHDQNTKIP